MMTAPQTLSWLLLLLISLFLAHQHKAAGRKTRLDIQNYGCNGNLLCDYGVVERNRISFLQSHGKALEKECCLPGVFYDSGDTPANLLCELNGHLMPCTSCLYGKWEEDVCAGQCGVFVYLILLLLLLLLLQYTRSGTVYAYSRSSAAVVSSTAATSGVGPRVTSLRGQSARRR